MSEENPQPTSAKAIAVQVVESAIVDLRETVDRLSLFRRQIATPDVDALLEVLCAGEASGVTSIAGLTTTANMSLIHQIGPGNNPQALFAIGVRAIETSVGWAKFGPAGGASEWQATVTGIVAMVRPTLAKGYPPEWSEALKDTPVEIASAEGWSAPPVGLAFDMMGAVAALDRAISHYSGAIAGLMQFVDKGVAVKPTQSNGDETAAQREAAVPLNYEWGATRISQLIFSGDRALGRAYCNIAYFLAAEDVWKPLSFIERDPSELSLPKDWLKAAWRVGVAQRAPAAVAITVAHGLARIAEPTWLSDLSNARDISKDDAILAEFKRSASKKHLVRSIKQGAQQPRKDASQFRPGVPAEAGAQTPTPKPPPPYNLGPEEDPAGFNQAMKRAANNPWATPQSTGIA